MVAPLTFLQKEKNLNILFFLSSKKTCWNVRFWSMCILHFKKHNVSNMCYLKVGFFFSSSAWKALYTGSFRRVVAGGQCAEAVLWTKSGPPRGESSTCLSLIRSRLWVGGGKHEHKGVLSQGPQIETSLPCRAPGCGLQPERADVQIYACHLWGSNLHYHVGHFVF